jgi:hypothetical protein
MNLELQLDRRPSVFAYHLRGFLPRLAAGRPVPPIVVRWQGYRVTAKAVTDFLDLTGLSPRQGWPLLFPQVSGFPLQMMVLTHPAFPLPFWGALQVRNRLVLHRALPIESDLEVETRVSGQRRLEKGQEVDLHTSVTSQDGGLLWEGSSTFYYRGRFAPAGGSSPGVRAPPVNGAPVASWRTGTTAGGRFAALTGDYNGVHLWSWYARCFGFVGAFQHPQLALAQCLSWLPADASPPRRLDAWLKGPVYYGARARLKACSGAGERLFALKVEGDDRPAIVGRLSAPERPEIEGSS